MSREELGREWYQAAESWRADQTSNPDRGAELIEFAENFVVQDSLTMPEVGLTQSSVSAQNTKALTKTKGDQMAGLGMNTGENTFHELNENKNDKTNLQ